MLTLLRNLRRLRTDVGLPAPTRGRSLAVRHVDAGSCNGCEHELTLAMSPYEDVQRYGFGIVASPRHADVLLVTGTVTTRMYEPLLAAYNAMPEPRRVIALGDCALARGVIAADTQIVGPVEAVLPVDLRVPGCPPSPATITQALLELHDAGNRPHMTEQRCAVSPVAAACPATPSPANVSVMSSGEDLRGLMRFWPHGVSVLAVDYEGDRMGVTLSSLVSLSLEPPLVGISVGKQASCYELLRRAGGYAVSMLGADQEDIARRFAAGHPPIVHWQGVDFREGIVAPLIEGAVGWIEARTVAEHDVGDHTFFVGEVIVAERGPSTRALMYRDRDYHGL